MNRLYNDVLAFEASLGLRFDWVLHVGDFGIWPNADEIDKATRKHDGAGDFPQWLEARCEAPRRTLFIKGNHEHFVWLDRQSGTEVLPNLHYLRNGCTFDLTDDHDAIRVGGIGGCYGPSDYERRSNRLQSYARRHYTRDEVETLAGAHGVHIVLTHDAPAGVRFERYRQRISFVSPAIGLDHVLASTRPRVCFFGHHHTRVDAEVAGIRCIGLNKVAGPGNLVAIEMENRTPQWSILGEWP